MCVQDGSYSDNATRLYDKNQAKTLNSLNKLTWKRYKHADPVNNVDILALGKIYLKFCKNYATKTITDSGS